MTLLIIFAIVSIFFSFICSIMEAVLLSITPSFINGKKSTNPKLAATLEGYKKDIDKPLSAILTLNTIAHTVGAIMVGAQAGKVFGAHYFTVPLLEIQMSYESLVAGVMTFAILVLSEIIPKTLGANYWRQLTPITVSALKVIMFILYPFIWFSMLITKYMKSSSVHSVFSREDYVAMTNLGGESGALAKNETTIISNLLGLDGITIKDIMTPRTVVHAVDQQTTLQSYFDAQKESPFSRVPIYEEQVDNIVGFVLKDDILKGIIEGKNEQAVKSIKRQIVAVDENKSLKEFFSFMTDQGQQMAIVTDEFGAISGLVTLEDMIETILGFEIMDESDKVPDLQAYARQKWQDRAKKIGIIE